MSPFAGCGHGGEECPLVNASRPALSAAMTKRAAMMIEYFERILVKLDNVIPIIAELHHAAHPGSKKADTQ